MDWSCIFDGVEILQEVLVENTYGFDIDDILTTRLDVDTEQ